MSIYVDNLIGQQVQVISIEGRVFIGVLVSFDNSMNILIKNCLEKIFSEKEGVKIEKMGLYMLRGDNVAIISELDESLEKNKKLSEIKGNPLKKFI